MMLMNLSILLLIPVVLADNHKMLPAKYEMEDYTNCVKNNDLYCKIDVRLVDKGNTAQWKIINESKSNQNRQNITVIHRGICVPREKANDSDSVRKFAEMHISQALNRNDLILYIDEEDIICTTNTVSISLYDKLVLILVVSYVLLIFYATFYDKQNRKHKSHPKNTGHKVLISFSLITNWEKLCKVDGDEDYTRLKSVQGIRSCIIITILFLHTRLSYSLIYISNPEEIGRLLGITLFEINSILDILFVQIFILLSSWIATFQIYNVYRESGEFNGKQVFVCIINRYFRLSICSSVMIFLLRSSWYRLLEGPITFDYYEIIQTACKQNWWQTFFLINNNLYYKDMCHPISWYLSVDFQLYTLVVLTVYIILKFKLNEWKVISLIFFLSHVVYGYFIFTNDMDIIARITENNLSRYSFGKSDSFKILYTSTYSSWPTSVIGILFGFLYTKNKNRSITNTKILSILCLLISLGLPSLAVMIARRQFRGIFAAIVGPLIKPLFCSGIAIGILGMSHNIGGFVKRFYENKIFVIMSNFSYSIYIFQFLIIFSKGIGSYSMLEIGVPQMIKSFLFVDGPLCILAGVIGALLFEQPGINLQKMFLPQLPRKKQAKY